MKNKLIIFVFFCCFIQLKSQEAAINYIVPKVKSIHYFSTASESEISTDVTSLSLGSKSFKMEYNTLMNTDNSVKYKIIHFTSSMDKKNNAYFVQFNGYKVNLVGYSKYNYSYGLFTTNSLNESYTEKTDVVYYQIPAESYQTSEWTYTDPATGSEVKAKSYYKTYKVNNTDERLLVVEKKSNEYGTPKTKVEYFMKNYGLIAFKNDIYSNLQIVDLSTYLMFSKDMINNKTEKQLIDVGWGIYNRAIKLLEDKNDRFYFNSEKNNLVIKYYDSLAGLYENIIRKTPASENIYKYIYSVYLRSKAVEVNNIVNVDKTKKESLLIEKLNLANNFYLVRPTLNSLPNYRLNEFLKDPDKNYNENFIHTMFLYYNSVSGISIHENSYKAYLFKDKVEFLEKNESLIANETKFVIFSNMASYFNYSNDNAKAYLYYVKTLESYKLLNEDNKNLNIDYMKFLMDKLIFMKPSNQTDLNRAINAAFSLNDNLNANKIADNGYNNGVGNDLEFGFLYAKAAYENNLNKNSLRNALKILQDKLNSMTVTQIKDYLKYCQAMNGEFDCSKAEAEVKAAEKREKEKLEKEEKERKKKQRKYSRGSFFSLAVSTNPLNLIWNTLPVALDIKLGKVLLQARVNDYNERSSKLLWGNMLYEPQKQFKKIVGRDYSLSILGRMGTSSYSSPVPYFGVHALYGNYNTEVEVVKAKDLSTNIQYNLRVSPVVSKYELMMKFHIPLTVKRNIFYACYFMDFGIGKRMIKYNAVNTANNSDVAEADLSDKTKYEFLNDEVNAGYRQERWNKFYIPFKLGFRIGLFLF